MASCPKCGKGKIRKRKNIRKCKRCGPMPWNGIGESGMSNLKVNGKEAANPFGSCFDAAAINLLANLKCGLSSMVMCHGIGVSNHPDSVGEKVAHAWIEFDHPKGRAAFDPIFLIAQSAEIYRKNFQAEFVVEYSKNQFISLWEQYDYPGPYDAKIKAIADKAVTQ